MANVAASARPVGAGKPPVRHGTCSPLWLRINGAWYTVLTLGEKPGFTEVWQVRKQDPERSGAYTVAQQGRKDPGCTCPDYEYNGFLCKHIRALQSVGLLKKARPRKPRETSARGRKLHAKNARQAIAAAQAIVMPEGWKPGGDHPDFHAGFQQAVRSHIGQLRGEITPTGPEPDDLVCDMCGEPYEPHAGHYREFCPECQGGVA